MIDLVRDDWCDVSAQPVAAVITGLFGNSEGVREAEQQGARLTKPHTFSMDR